MVEGYAHITLNGVTMVMRMSPLDTARVYMQSRGWDVDAEPILGDRWKITASSLGGKATVSKTGTLQTAVSELMESIK